MRIVLKPVRDRIYGSFLKETTFDTIDNDMNSLVHFFQRHYGMKVTKAAPYVFDVSKLTDRGEVHVGIICVED